MRLPGPIALLATLAAVSFVLVAASIETQREPDFAAQSRQFDFWLGEWEVISADGQWQGTNTIELAANGRGLLEQWRGNPVAGNSTGTSLNAWNADRQQWQQFWVGSNGRVLELAGGLDAQGRMVLTGDREVHGRKSVDRITWTPNADGSVRQQWEQSLDGGRTWHPVFDGRYERKKARVATGGARHSRALYHLFW